MRTRIHTLLVAAALLGMGATPALGQNTTVDSRWLAYLGCWEPTQSAKSQVCVVPVAGTPDVELITIVKGEVAARERITANGERQATSHDSCTGWQTVEWSVRGQRLYVRSGDTCPSGENTGTGVIAMTGDGDGWLYIQGMTQNGQEGVSVQRYREARSDVLLPDDIKAAVPANVSARMQARAAAAVALSTDDVIEATRHVDAPVIQAWLVGRGEGFVLDAKRLVALADAHVPSSVIDLMVALSYPKSFAINLGSRQGERRASAQGAGGGPGEVYASRPVYAPLDECSMTYLVYNYVPSLCSSFYPGYGFGSGFYPGGYPVLIVYTGSSSRGHGRVVNGQGYREGTNGGTTTPGMPKSGDVGSVSPGGFSSGSGSSTSSTSSSGSSGSGRTAHQRP